MFRYRPAPEEEGGSSESASSPKKTKSEKASKHSVKSRKDEAWVEGVIAGPVSPLEGFLAPDLPPTVSVRDPALQVIALLRVLHALNHYWSSLYEVKYKQQTLFCIYQLSD